MLQFGGLAIMPFALLVLGGGGNAAAWPAWIGQLGAGIAFLLVGAGLHTTQTAGLALATDLTAEASKPRVVGLMYVMLLAGSVVSALVFGRLLADFNPGKLVQVIQGAALTTMVLNVIALWKQETRRPPRGRAQAVQPGFREAWRAFSGQAHAMRRLVAIGLGTMAFGMHDVLLEPYGGQVLGMSVGATTSLTATLAAGGLLGFGWASGVLSRGADPFRMAAGGALVGIPAFLAVMLAAPSHSVPLFGCGVLLIGLGGGIFSHGTLTATMNAAPPEQAGLALGTWGAVQATAAGIAVALGGVLRDLISALAGTGIFGTALAGPATGYSFVYAVEVALLIATVGAMSALIGSVRPAAVPGLVQELERRSS